MINGVMYFDAAGSRLGGRCAHRPRALALRRGKSNGGNHIGNRGVGISGDCCISKRRIAISSRSTSRTAPSAGTSRSAISISSTTRRLAPVIDQEPRHRRRERRRPGHPRLPRGARPGDRRNAVALVCRAAEEGTIRARTRWPNEEAAKHGGGMTWQPVTYDPELNLIYVDDRQSAAGRRPQESRRRQSLHRIDRRAQPGQRQDGVVLPVVAARHARLGRDADAGADRRRVRTASRASCWRRPSRNGKFFVLDRTNGKAIVSTEFVKTNWSKGFDAKGQPIPNPAKNPQIDGALGHAEPGRRDELAAAELQPAHRTVLRAARRRPTASGTSTIRATTRRAGAAPIAAAVPESMLQAIDYKTGKVRWTHKWEGGPGQA